MTYFLSVLGLVLIVEGIPWFLSPAKTKKFLSQIHSFPDSQLRFLGLTAMLVGLLVIRLST